MFSSFASCFSFSADSKFSFCRFSVRFLLFLSLYLFIYVFYFPVFCFLLSAGLTFLQQLPAFISDPRSVVSRETVRPEKNEINSHKHDRKRQEAACQNKIYLLKYRRIGRFLTLTGKKKFQQEVSTQRKKNKLSHILKSQNFNMKNRNQV